MPSRNIHKVDAPDAYYHIYTRGVSKQRIFNSPQDYRFFLSLFARYLSKTQQKNTLGVPYPHFASGARLVAYCLMGNHVHLLLHQLEAGAMASLMRCIMTSYSGYFNHTHKRRGPLFESRYKASMIGSVAYLEHITRYIHLNPRYWQRYPYSSFSYYMRESVPEWLAPDSILSMFSDRSEYRQFVADYEASKAELEEFKHMLADQ